MRIITAALLVLCCCSIAEAQVSAPGNAPDKPSVRESDGRTTVPEPKGQLQPQGWTGPIETKSGGAPAESPQGQSPPGMQAAPEGSSKTVVEPAK
jgi:hypothetical protein